MSELPLTQAEIEAYRAIAAGETPPDGASLDGLLGLRLITAHPYGTDHYVAADPRAAAHQLITDAQDALTRTVQSMEQARGVESLSRYYDAFRFFGAPGSEFLGGPGSMNARITEVSGRATGEILTAQPGEPADRDPETVREGIAKVHQALARGVSVRTLYSTAARSHEPTRRHVEEIAEAGAEVRFYSRPFPRLIVIDAEHAFLDDFVSGHHRDSGWHVGDRGAVTWARQAYLMIWEQADNWADVYNAPASVLTPRQESILTELAAGRSQPQVKDRLGLAERTIGKELSAIKAAIGAKNLYEVMYWWGKKAQLPD
ncbi:LuxR C-terminal-related transcriptional regulator [Streptomyces scopuliridis]|uniref:LuxR C-terminal-related transcriptional regulator n=1 Tax=Streptomyces scopuliridis TaxID=452529 RepID=UPI0036B5AEDC